MATRIEIELTSRRDDTFTWRAAGAREPKGVADAALFPAGSSVGEQFKVEADFDLDGITVTNVLPKEEKKRSAFDTLELLTREDEPLVTQQLAEKGRRDRGERRGGGREKRRDGDKDRERGERRPRSGGDQRPRTPAKPKLPPKPKPPRLKPARTHRDELLGSLPEEQKPVAQELLRGGLPAVRTALAKQNEQQRKEGAPEIDEGPILALAEELLVRVRTAEWRDRAEAALEQAEVVDVRDLRTVVTAAEGMGRDEETRALGSKLRTALSERLDAEHHAWVNEIIELLDDDRVVRALHLSSRPPKAGAPLPAPVALRLVEAANASMTSEITPDRWSYILEALAHSPVRRQVVPASLPTNVTPELKATIARFGVQLPEIAQIFGIEPDPRAGRGGERRSRRPKGGRKGEPKAGEAKGRGKESGDRKGGDEKSGDREDAGPKADGERPTDEPKGDGQPAAPEPAPLADDAASPAEAGAAESASAESDEAPTAEDASAAAEPAAAEQAEAPTEQPAPETEPDTTAASASETTPEGEQDAENRVPAGGPPHEGDPTDATTPPPGGGITADEPSAEG